MTKSLILIILLCCSFLIEAKRNDKQKRAKKCQNIALKEEELLKNQPEILPLNLYEGRLSLKFQILKDL